MENVISVLSRVGGIHILSTYMKVIYTFILYIYMCITLHNIFRCFLEKITKLITSIAVE